MITTSSKFYVNSRNRTSGTDSDFSYYFDVPKDSKYNKVCLLQASIPKSYYMVQPGEYFTLSEGLNTTQIAVSPANYTRKSFAAVIQASLTTNSPNGWVYVITYNTSSTVGDTGKYTFTVTGNGVIQPSFIFTTDNDLYSQMGFNDGSTNVFVGNSLISTNVINLQRENTLFIHSDIVRGDNNNILQEIYAADSPDYSSVTFLQQTVEAYSKDITFNSSNTYNFYLTNENGDKMDLNGQNINFTLLMYKSNDIYDMIRQFLKFQIIKK